MSLAAAATRPKGNRGIITPAQASVGRAGWPAGAIPAAVPAVVYPPGSQGHRLHRPRWRAPGMGTGPAEPGPDDGRGKRDAGGRACGPGLFGPPRLRGRGLWPPSGGRRMADRLPHLRQLPSAARTVSDSPSQVGPAASGGGG